MEKTLRIDGMNCGHCTAAVAKALRAIPGVMDAKVDLASKTAVVEVSGAVTGAALEAAVTEAGYTVVGMA